MGLANRTKSVNFSGLRANALIGLAFCFCLFVFNVIQYFFLFSRILRFHYLCNLVVASFVAVETWRPMSYGLKFPSAQVKSSNFTGPVGTA